MCATVLLAQLTTNDPLIERAESGCENPKGHILHWWLAEKRSCKLNYSDKQSLQGIRFNCSRIEEKQWVRLMLLVLLTICLEEIQTKSHPKKKNTWHIGLVRGEDVYLSERWEKWILKHWGKTMVKLMRTWKKSVKNQWWFIIINEQIWHKWISNLK